MAISSLSAQYVSASFQNLIQISSSGQVFDGLGNQITNLTASFATTASYISPTFISASAAASGFGSGGTGTTIDTSSFATTGSNTFIGNQTITGSLFVTQSHISTVDYIDFNTTPSLPAFLTGRLHWTDDTKTLQLDTDVSNFELEIGHQSVIRGRNVNSFTLTKGTVVYINGESGNRPTFATASWEGDPSSATTIGIIAQDIINSQTGYAVTNGLIRGVNTNAFLPGTSLYLSSSGQYTDTPPASPLHEVRLGKTITQATSGTLYIDIQNGYELGELHDVLAVSASNGDLLVYSGSIWINTKQLTGSYVLAGSLNATSVTASLFGTASYAVNSLTASYALAGGSGGISSTVSTAQTGSVTGTTSETLIQSLIIPANTLSTDDFARISSKIFATNSSNYSLGMYINSANSLNGSEKMVALVSVNSAIKYSVITRTIAVSNATTDTNWISDSTIVQDPAQGSNSLAHASSSIDWTTTQYALITVLPQNSGDSFICRGTYFEKI